MIETNELKNLKKKCPTFREFCEIKGLKEGDYYNVLDYMEYCDGLTLEQQIEITRKWLLKGVKTMNREILFRGKRVDDGELVISDSLMQVKGQNPRLWVEFDGWVEVLPETVGQFTGLTAINGKKIFEGDIMQLCSACYPCFVYWDGISWAWRRNGKRIDLTLVREKMEIIGNIYENKELLEDDK